MTKMDRRSLLTGLVAAPLLGNSALRSSSLLNRSAISAGTRWLYVYLHGAFLVDMEPGGLRIFAPATYVTYGVPASGLAHAYQAGYAPGGQGVPVALGAPLGLSGFQGAGSAPKIDETACPCFKNVGVVTTNTYFSVMTPFPSAIVPSRQIDIDPQIGPFFNDAALKNLQSLPLLLTLEFELRSGESVSLVGGQPSRWVDDGRNPLILHFRAEPRAQNCFAHNAMLDLGDMVGHNNLMLTAGYTCDIVCAKNAEELSLLELLYPSATNCVPVTSCTGGKATGMLKECKESARPANCVGIIANNTGG